MKSPYKLSWFQYKVVVQWTGTDGKCQYSHKVVRKLDIVAYWLIRWYHGEAALYEMAVRAPEDRLKCWPRIIDYTKPRIL